MNIRGYTQVRYNRLFGDGQIIDPNDCSIGGNNGFLIRRARVILFGDVHPQLSVYLQPDFASIVSADAANFAQMRDLVRRHLPRQGQGLRIRVGH